MDFCSANRNFPSESISKEFSASERELLAFYDKNVFLNMFLPARQRLIKIVVKLFQLHTFLITNAVPE